MSSIDFIRLISSNIQQLIILIEVYCLRTSLHKNDIIEGGGVLLADVFAFEVPRLVCSALDSYLNGIVVVLAVDGIYGSGKP